MKQANRVIIAIAAVGLACIVLMPGTAACAMRDAMGGGMGRHACADDIAKFCQDVEPGAFALMSCLEKHESELSPACKEFEATMGSRRMERGERVRGIARFRQACMNDMSKLCKDANPMQAGMIKCLDEHDSELSPTCREMMKEMTLLQEFQGGVKSP